MPAPLRPPGRRRRRSARPQPARRGQPALRGPARAAPRLRRARRAHRGARAARGPAPALGPGSRAPAFRGAACPARAGRGLPACAPRPALPGRLGSRRGAPWALGSGWRCARHADVRGRAARPLLIVRLRAPSPWGRRTSRTARRGGALWPRSGSVRAARLAQQ